MAFVMRLTVTIFMLSVACAITLPDQGQGSMQQAENGGSADASKVSTAEGVVRDQEAAALANVDKEENRALEALEKAASKEETQKDSQQEVALESSTAEEALSVKPSKKTKVMFPSEYLQRVHDGCNNCDGKEFQCCCCAEGSPQGNDCQCCECPEAMEGADGDATHWLHKGDGKCTGTASCIYNPSYSKDDIELQSGTKLGFATWEQPAFKKTEVSLNQCQELCRMFDDCLGISFKEDEDPQSTDCVIHYKYPSGAEDGTLQQVTGTPAQLGGHYICDKGPGDAEPADSIGGVDDSAGYVCKGRP